MDIPVLHSYGVDYIITPLHKLEEVHVNLINDALVCLTTIENLENLYQDIEVQVVQLDFSKILPSEKNVSSLFSVAVAFEEDGEDGLDCINKHLYSAYSAVKTNVVNVVVPAVAVTPVVEDTMIEAEPIADNVLADKTELSASKLLDLTISSLIADPKYQFRVNEDEATISELAGAFRVGEDIPAIDVVCIGGTKHYITDGFHRHSGAVKAEMETMKCNVVIGSHEDALKLALCANAQHKSLKRTNKDKQKAVQAALAVYNLSNRQIAEMCKVSPGLVDKIVKASETSTAYIGTQDNEQTSKDEIVSDTTNIGVSRSDIPTKTPSSKYVEKLSNKYVSLSLEVKEVSDDEAIYSLLADLNEALKSYELEIKEVN